MTSDFLDAEPARWASGNPLGRTGQPHEIRGVVAWLASDASTYCTGSECVISAFRVLLPADGHASKTVSPSTADTVPGENIKARRKNAEPPGRNIRG